MISLSTLSIFVIPRCYDKYVPGIVVVHRTLTDNCGGCIRITGGCEKTHTGGDT
jgi:hypothetical protein